MQEASVRDRAIQTSVERALSLMAVMGLLRGVSEPWIRGKANLVGSPERDL